LNHLISISEAQDIPVWISSVESRDSWPQEGFLPKFAGLIRRIFFGPRTELKSAKMRDWIEEGHWKLERGAWIIINDMIFTTPNKKNKTLQLHPPSDFFPFFSANSCCFSFIITPDFWSCIPCFYCLISKRAAGSMEGKKRVALSSN